MKVLIHIGYHKTGTTWFQKQFYPFVRNFEYFSNRKLLRDTILNSDYYYYSPIKAREKIGIYASRDVIICEENIVSGVRGSALINVAIAERINNTFPEGEIIIFIRNQLDRLVSTYLYYLFENGGTYGPKNFIEKLHGLPYQKGDVNFQNLEYHFVIDHYKKLFGNDKVHVFLYEEFAENNELFLNKYSDLLQLDIDIKSINFKRENQGLRKRLIPLARFLGLFYSKPIIHKSIIINLPFLSGISKIILRNLNYLKVFGEKPNPKSLFGDDLYNKLFNYYKKSNQILKETHKISNLDKYNYPL
jgi:hypothetical protein